MNNITSPTSVIDILKKHNLSTKKRLGQNFLVDRNVLSKIILAADLSPEDNVLEIGTGLGTLTCELAAKAKRVVTIEIDKDLIPVLNDTFKNLENVSLIHGDILKIDLLSHITEHFGEQSFKVVANVPYYVSTPIIMLFCKKQISPSKMVFMLQKEVAQRIAAHAGGKDYGILTLMIQYSYNPKVFASVSPNVFFPPPKVESSILTLEKRQEPIADVLNETVLFDTIKAGFAQRRKTLLNSLSSSGKFGQKKSEIQSVLEKIGIDQNRRAESLDIVDYVSLSNELSKLQI